MTEKEKLIEIIKQNGVYNGSSMGIEYYVVKPEWLADTLIENGIEDIVEWKAKQYFYEYYGKLSNLPYKEYCEVNLCIDLDELAKEYGVEVEE